MFYFVIRSIIVNVDLMQLCNNKKKKDAMNLEMNYQTHLLSYIHVYLIYQYSILCHGILMFLKLFITKWVGQ